MSFQHFVMQQHLQRHPWGHSSDLDDGAVILLAVLFLACALFSAWFAWARRP